MKNKYLITSFLALTVVFIITQCTQVRSVSQKESRLPVIQPDLEMDLEPGYAPFPKGFDYPQNYYALNHWIQSGNDSAIRRHAFGLFAGLNQTLPDGRKIWQTWYPVTEVISPDNKGVEANFVPIKKARQSLATRGLPDEEDQGASSPPWPLPLPQEFCKNLGSGKRFFFTSFIIIPGTFYNRAAKDWIQGKNLDKASALDNFQNAGKKNIPEAPSNSIIMKHVFWPVSGRTGDFTPLPVFDGDEGMDSLAYNGYATWKRAVAISAAQNPPARVDSLSYLYGYQNREAYQHTFYNVKTVGLDRFLTIKLTGEYIATLNEVDKCVLNNSFNHVFRRDYEEGDYIVSIGTHIMTKEIKDWCMQTAWWHDNPNQGPFAAQRPKDFPPGPWENYLMNTSYVMAIPNNAQGKPKVAYNPYIELTLPEQNRIHSNCQNCHMRAAWPMPEGSFKVVDLVGTKDPVFPKEATPFYHTMREGWIGEDDPIFNGLMRTDMNWGIPDRAVGAK